MGSEPRSCFWDCACDGSEDITVIANNGDDLELLGLRISPTSTPSLHARRVVIKKPDGVCRRYVSLLKWLAGRGACVVVASVIETGDPHIRTVNSAGYSLTAVTTRFAALSAYAPDPSMCDAYTRRES